MKRSDVIRTLKISAAENNADFISEKYIESLFPEPKEHFYMDEVEGYKEIINHDILCLKEFMELANDRLLDMTQNNEFCITISHTGL